MADPHGIRRPDPGLLLEHDDYSIICAELRAYIRARIAAAHDRVSLWELPSLPATQMCPAVEYRPRRGTTTLAPPTPSAGVRGTPPPSASAGRGRGR